MSNSKISPEISRHFPLRLPRAVSGEIFMVALRSASPAEKRSLLPIEIPPQGENSSLSREFFFCVGFSSRAQNLGR